MKTLSLAQKCETKTKIEEIKSQLLKLCFVTKEKKTREAALSEATKMSISTLINFTKEIYLKKNEWEWTRNEKQN